MKVVLFCGEHGMRRRNSVEDGTPTLMRMVGPRPLIWHVMRYYANFGHKDFILCLGFGAELIKNYLLTYQESASNDFVLHGGEIELMRADISDWSITFVGTGRGSAIGDCLRRVRGYLDGDQYFLANYADVLTDAPIDDVIEKFRQSGAAASMLVLPPQSSFHCVEIKESGEVKDIMPVSKLPFWENGGFFVLSQEIFDLLPPGGDLVEDVCKTLAGQGRLFGYRYDGFWNSVDTSKELAELDARYHRGDRPWMVWQNEAEEPALSAAAKAE
jgi:glucose-1-phosphate cytidylyltransferase